MDIPLIWWDKIRSLIKNATKDSSTWSNESLMKTNTRDENNLIKDSNQLEMDKKNKIVIDNLNKWGPLTKKMAWVIEGKIKSGWNNVWGGINVNQWIKTTNPEIKNEWMNENLWVNVNNWNYNWIRLTNDNGKIVNSGWRIYDDGKKWWQNESIGKSKEKSQALVDLYKVAWRLNEREEDLDIKQLRENFSEFEGLDDNVLSELVNDMRYMVENEDEDLLKIIEAYPELWKVRLEDLNNASKAKLIGDMIDWNDEKWWLVDWLTWQPNLLTQAITGKTWTQWLGELGDWAYDSKKMVKYTNKDEDEFIRNLQKEYSKYMNENGEWLEPGGEASKQFNKELSDYQNKALANNVGNSVLNFFKWLPKVLDTVLNIWNHPGELVKTLPRLLAGAPMTWTEWIADKVEEKTGNNFMDKLAQRKGYDTWQEIKEAMQDKAKNGKWPFYKVANWVFESSEVSDWFKEYIVDSYGSDEKFLQTLIERPEDVISDFVSVLEWWVGIAKWAGLIDATRAEMIIKNLGYLDMYEVGTKWVFQAEKWLAKNQLKLAEKSIWKTMKGTEKVWNLLKKSPVWKMVSFVENKLTGLSEEERKFIRENWDIVEEYLKGNRSADEIAEMIMNKFDDLIEWKKEVWKFYDIVKNNDKLLVKTSWIVSWIKWLLNELWIKIDNNWVLKFGELSYTPSQQKQLQQVYWYVKALENLGDSATAKDVWRARQLIDSLANWEGNTKMWLDAEVMNSIRNMRWKIDDALKEQVKGFKEADTEYRELSKTVKELRKDWFTKEGNLKDNALSKIRNLTNKGNEAKLERLEKNFPWITRSLKWLWVSQSIEKASKMMVGQYAQQLLIGWWLWKLINGDLSVATALIWAWILTPKNLVKILKKEWDFMSKWRSVADNLSNGKVLSDEKINRLKRWLKDKSQEIGQKVAEEEWGKWWEKVDMDKVDLEYDKAQKKAYLGGKSTEKKLTKEERASLLKKYAKWSENNGFVMKIVDDMWEWTHWMADLDRKLVKLEENFGDTTAQHEFFHELFSVIDEDTKKYVINEVKNYLDLTDDVAAEEWLAESFGIYARRKEIKLWNIRLKGNRLQRFQSKLRDLFQRAYEWIQDYSMDRKTINKLFNEVYGAVDGKVLDETWKFNLAEKLGINKKSPKLWVSENWLRYKKGWNLWKNDYKDTAVKAQHDGLWEKTPLTAVRGQNFNDSGLFWWNKDSKWHYIIKGGREKQVIYTKINNGKAKFSGYKMELQEKNRKYYDNVVNALNRFEKRWYNNKDILIWKTPRGKDIYITDKDLVHIFKEHWEFYIENLIESVNDGRDGFWETKANKRYGEGALGLRPRMEIEIPGKNEKFIVGLMSDGSDEFNSTRYNVKSLRESKPSQVESRWWVKFKKDIYNDKWYTKPEYRYDPRSSLPTVRGWWTKAKIEKYLRNSAASSPKWVYTALSAIREFDSVDDFKNHVFYHGTQWAFVWRPTMSIPEKTFDKYADRFGGWYGQRYWAISLTTDKKIASNFWGASSSVNINPVILRKDAKVIEMPQLTDSIELDSHIEKLWNDWVDAVWIWDKNAGEKELAVINPKAIVNVDNADSYRVYHLGMNDNPLKISSDADFKRIYDDAPRLQDEIDRTQKAYMDYEKEWLGKRWIEKYEIWEEWWLEKSRKEREARNEIKEEEGYKWLYGEYLDAKSKARGEVRWKKVYHGSPYEFEKFDSTNMWKWEWNQAHWWGHYVAVDEKTGRYYADTLNWPKYKWKEKYQLADLWWHEYNVLTTILDKVADGVEPGKAIEDTKKWYKELIDEQKEILKTEKDLNERDWAEKEINRYNERLKVLDGLKEDDFKSSKWNRNLYEVEIPDPVKRDTPTWSNYIEEDSKIWDKAFNKMIKWFEDDWWKVEEHYWNYDVEKWGVAFNLTNWDNTWRDLIRDEIEDQKAFSEVLDRMWYDWIHYYGWRDWESYVIFNDKKATITNHLRFKKWLNKKLSRVWVMNSKGNVGWLNRKGLTTVAKWLRYKEKQDLKN